MGIPSRGSGLRPLLPLAERTAPARTPRVDLNLSGAAGRVCTEVYWPFPGAGDMVTPFT